MPLLKFIRSISERIKGETHKPDATPPPKSGAKKSKKPAKPDTDKSKKPGSAKSASKPTRKPERRERGRDRDRERPAKTSARSERPSDRTGAMAPRGQRRKPRPRVDGPRHWSPQDLPPPQPKPKAAAEPWDPSVFVVEPQEGKKRFQDFALPGEILHAVYDLGFQYCSPIQAATLEQTMEGLNVAGKAQTGTGKTAAFLIAIIYRMLKSKTERPTQPARPTALVLAPTRELVVQIVKDADDLGKYAGLRSVAVYGGMDHAKQQEWLAESPVDLVAATPGRLLDFIRSRAIDLGGVQTLVIDEADRMLDMGFIPDVSRIIRSLPGKDRRQTLLFSATLTQEVMRLARQWMPDPVEVAVDAENATVDTIKQIVYPIASREKFTVLYNILKQHEGKRFLVFRNRKRDCDDLCRELVSYGIGVEELSGDVEQKKRLRILEDFRAGKTLIVVATDVAGRGIHVDDIACVVNYDFPYEAEDYIHRIGRTGRAGSTGTAISFACEDESFIIPEIEEILGETLHCQQPEDHLLKPVPEEARIAPRKPRKDRPGGSRGGGGSRRPRTGGAPRGGRRGGRDQGFRRSRSSLKPGRR
ncbi:MAG: DEAD/DEAH box helicase [Kiritimatiellia bacterium]|jgi:ATP-dependent RNA helicase RhlB